MAYYVIYSFEALIALLEKLVNFEKYSRKIITSSNTTSKITETIEEKLITYSTVLNLVSVSTFKQNCCKLVACNSVDFYSLISIVVKVI